MRTCGPGTLTVGVVLLLLTAGASSAFSPVDDFSDMAMGAEEEPGDTVRPTTLDAAAGGDGSTSSDGTSTSADGTLDGTDGTVGAPGEAVAGDLDGATASTSLATACTSDVETAACDAAVLAAMAACTQPYAAECLPGTLPGDATCTRGGEHLHCVGLSTAPLLTGEDLAIAPGLVASGVWTIATADGDAQLQVATLAAWGDLTIGEDASTCDTACLAVRAALAPHDARNEGATLPSRSLAGTIHAALQGRPAQTTDEPADTRGDAAAWLPAGGHAAAYLDAHDQVLYVEGPGGIRGFTIGTAIAASDVAGAAADADGAVSAAASGDAPGTVGATAGAGPGTEGNTAAADGTVQGDASADGEAEADTGAIRSIGRAIGGFFSSIGRGLRGIFS